MLFLTPQGIQRTESDNWKKKHAVISYSYVTLLCGRYGNLTISAPQNKARHVRSRMERLVVFQILFQVTVASYKNLAIDRETTNRIIIHIRHLPAFNQSSIVAAAVVE